MRTRRLSFLVALVALIGLGMSWGYGQGKTRQAVAPESLLPEESVLLVHVDGSLLHADAFQKTAAYDALYKSGLMGAIEKTLNRAKSLAGPAPVKPYLDAIKLISDKGFSLAVSPGMGDRGPQPWGVVVLHEGAALDKMMSSLVQLGANGEVKPERKTIGKRTVVRFDIPDSPGVEVGWWPEGKHLVIAVGINAIEQSLAVADAQSPNVTTNPLWTKYSQSTETELTSFAWLNLVPVRAIFGGMPVPTQNPDKPTSVHELLMALGLDNLNSIGMQAGIKDRSLTALTSIDAPGERRGLLSLLDQEPMTMGDLPPLPQQLSSFMASSFDSGKSLQTLFQTAVEVEALLSPDTANVEAARGMVKDRLGLDPIDDLLAGFGNVHCFYSDEAQAGIGLAPVLLVEVQDAGKVNTALERLLVEMVPQLSEGKAKVVVKEKDDTKTYTVECPMIGISPALSVSDKWMCVSLMPQPVMAFNLRVAGELPTWDAATLPPETTAAIPASFTGLTIVDPRSTYRVLVGLAPLAAGVAQSAMEQAQRSSQGDPKANVPVIFQASDLPPAEMVTKWLYPNVSYSLVDENGLTTRTTSSIPGLPIPGGDGGSASVAVPAVLVALLLPAVQQAREAARRSQSKNNMKQIGLAMHNYHDVFNAFPAGTVENADLPVEQRLSWMVSILPYLEQAALYNLVNKKEGFESGTNSPIMENRIVTYMNPSMPARVSMYGETHYVGIAGITEDGPTAKLPSKIAGVFGYDRQTRMSDIQDGTSNTIMVAESYGGPSGPWGQGGAATIRPFTQQPYIKGPDGIGGTAGGGGHILLSDGSVRFVSEHIDPKLVEALSTIQGEEVVGEF